MTKLVAIKNHRSPNEILTDEKNTYQDMLITNDR